MTRKYSPRSRGFTLVEVLVASAITLMLMAALASVFSFVNNTVAESRATVEMADRLRACKHRLQRDLALVTAPTIPPLRPEAENGYLEIIEGPIGPIFRPDDLESAANRPLNQDRIEWDDPDDVIMFTARADASEPFVGRWNGSSTERSQVAEIAWFLRGTTLYRRLLLVVPQANNPWDYSYTRGGSASYNSYDVSLRQEGGAADRRAQPPGGVINNMPRCIPNSLGDLTNRENRFAHQPLAWPYESRMWGRVGGSAAPGLGLPTLAECSHSNWPFPIYENPGWGYVTGSTMAETAQGGPDPRDLIIVPTIRSTTSPATFSSISRGGITLSANGIYDPLGTHPVPFTSANPIRYPNIRPVTQIDSLNRLNNFTGGRFDDIIMTDVMSFDVKVWDPGAPLFECTGISGGSTITTPIMPGDWGYIDAVKQFVTSGSSGALRLVGFGGYVDLNYMQSLGNDPYDPAIMRIVPPMAPASATLPPPPPYPALSPAGGNYEVALQKLEGGPAGQRVLPRPKFSGPGDSGCAIHGILARAPYNTSPLSYPDYLAAVYDTWSTSYERDGKDNDGDGLVDEGTDGADNPPYRFGIDDPSEVDAPPPYPWSLRGVQIKIRAFEPGTKQIREVTVVTEFLPE